MSVLSPADACKIQTNDSESNGNGLLLVYIQPTSCFYGLKEVTPIKIA